MKYIVIALSVGGAGKRIFHAGDVVTERDFPEGQAPELVEKGFLKPIEESYSEPKTPHVVPESIEVTAPAVQPEIQAEKPKSKPKKK